MVKCVGRSVDTQEISSEIFALGVGDVDGVIFGSSQLLNHCHIATNKPCRFIEITSEEVWLVTNCSATGAGQE
jgi:hypothetical protein